MFLDSWERDVESRSGFSKAEKERMLISAETRLGLRMTGIILHRNYYGLSLRIYHYYLYSQIICWSCKASVLSA